MNLVTSERFPKGFHSTATGIIAEGRDIESYSRQIILLLIIESKLSKFIQMSESSNPMQTIDH